MEDGLNDECGHHCGVEKVGSTRRVGHCKCPECHGSVADVIMDTTKAPLLDPQEVYESTKTLLGLQNGHGRG